MAPSTTSVKKSKKSCSLLNILLAYIGVSRPLCSLDIALISFLNSIAWSNKVSTLSTVNDILPEIKYLLQTS